MGEVWLILVTHDREVFTARCATTMATPPSVATEAVNNRNVICSESRMTPPKAAIIGTVS